MTTTTTAGGHPAIPRPDDPLAEALHAVRMEGMFYCRSEFREPWGLTLPPMPDHLWFHVVTRGRGVLVDHRGSEHVLQDGDVLVLPHGSGHRLRDDERSPTPVVFDLPHDEVSSNYAVLRHGGDGAACDLVCGVVRLGHPAARSLVDLLPEVLRIDGRTAAGRWPWLHPLLAMMADETQRSRPGGEAVVTRLCDVLVIQAIRHWIEDTAAQATGWLAALRDPDLGPAIAAVHRDPARDWTVADLAAEAAMSRSSFAARFTDLVGEPAMTYVTRWRMQVAVDLLREERLTVAAVAERLGYGSEAAFSRAFKRVTGQSPSESRAAGVATPP